ncbi:Uncharacterised protein [Vibrio cholerae]|uniref:Uncharacterized protein n=1 Tax=Vibrio cholerae TaxID=666 RepID=A0A655ZX04_VIBCL|nr:Uncharacterised protein [Vibrio cholerae]
MAQPVSIAIGFHHRHDFTLWRLLLNALQVVLQRL